MKTYLVRMPGDVYPQEYKAKNEKHARAQARWWWNIPRLPTGTEVWEFTSVAQHTVEESRREMAADYAKAGQIAEL